MFHLILGIPIFKAVSFSVGARGSSALVFVFVVPVMVEGAWTVATLTSVTADGIV